MKKFTAAVVLFLLPALGFPAGSKINWKLEKSEITYTVTHPFHVVHGKSIAAKGEGLRNSNGTCQFLVAVPVKSFNSGDNNRDLHMQEVTKAGLNPLIKVNVEIAKIADQKAPQTLEAEADIDFAGKKASYPKVKLEVVEWKEGRIHITGIVPLTLKDFEITPPSLLTLPINNEVPVKLDMWWSGAGSKEKAEKK